MIRPTKAAEISKDDVEIKSEPVDLFVEDGENQDSTHETIDIPVQNTKIIDYSKTKNEVVNRYKKYIYLGCWLTNSSHELS